MTNHTNYEYHIDQKYITHAKLIHNMPTPFVIKYAKGSGSFGVNVLLDNDCDTFPFLAHNKGVQIDINQAVQLRNFLNTQIEWYKHPLHQWAMKKTGRGTYRG